MQCIQYFMVRYRISHIGIQLSANMPKMPREFLSFAHSICYYVIINKTISIMECTLSLPPADALRSLSWYIISDLGLEESFHISADGIQSGLKCSLRTICYYYLSSFHEFVLHWIEAWCPIYFQHSDSRQDILSRKANKITLGNPPSPARYGSCDW